MSSSATQATANPRVVRVAVPVPLYREFDYGLPADAPQVNAGARLRVPFAGRLVTGICTDPSPGDPHPEVRLVDGIIDPDDGFGSHLRSLAQWLASYYHHPLGEVFSVMLPAALRSQAEPAAQAEERYFRAIGSAAELTRAPKQAAAWQQVHGIGIASASELRAAGIDKRTVDALLKRGLLITAESAPEEREPEPQLTTEQAAAVQAITAAHAFETFLLDGITGSGKTEVYLRALAAQHRAGRQVLVLVPEIALTPQTVARFERRFGTAAIAVAHSNLTDQARAHCWLRCKRGDAKILIGTRSAVFTPFHDLGLIIVDEEHDGSFKQADGLRYSARDVAVKRAQELAIPVVLGSATPALESLHNAEAGRYRHLKLLQRPGRAEPPSFNVLDCRGLPLTGGVSPRLATIIDQHLALGQQALVFINRRGYAPTLLCAACGWLAQCEACEARMTLHQHDGEGPGELRCHHCSRRQPAPLRCPACGHESSLLPVGTGTQRTAEFLQQRYASVPVVRVDRDTTRSQRSLEAQLAIAHRGEPAVLVGTQMLAKGHHFPNVTLVAVLNADGGFFSPDFRAAEHTAQLIIQVAGRAGRAEKPGEVWIQTLQPDNPQLTRLMEAGYAGFAQVELSQRKAAAMPPFAPLALLRAEAPQAGEASSFLHRLRSFPGLTATVLGPAPAPISRVADRYRFQLLISADSRRELHAALKQLTARITEKPPPRGLRWSVDVDPFDTL